MVREQQYYFSHDAHARHDPKIIGIMSIHGTVAYAWYFMMLEMMREQDDFVIPLTKIQQLVLGKELNIEMETLNRFVQDCKDVGLFIEKQTETSIVLTSNGMQNRMSQCKQKKLQGQKAINKRWHGQYVETKELNTDVLPTKNGRNTIKEKKRKEKNIKDKDKSSPIPFDFDLIWQLYPKKVGRQDAERHFKKSVKTEEDFAAIGKAVKNYTASERVVKGFVRDGSTWFKNWQDWIIDPEPEKKELIDFSKYDDKGNVI